MSLIELLLIAAGVYVLIQIENRLEDIRSALDGIGMDVKDPE